MACFAAGCSFDPSGLGTTTDADPLAPDAVSIDGLVAIDSATDDGPTSTADASNPPPDAALSAPWSLEDFRVEVPCIVMTSSFACTAGANTDTLVLDGPAGTFYDVQVRLRGVVEQKTYVGGTQTGFWYEGGVGADAGWNEFRIDISSPSTHFFLNAGASGTVNCFELDQTVTFTVEGNATFTLSGDALDGQQVRNIDGSGQPIVPAGVPPAPSPYDGQFVHFDVLSVTPQ